MRRDGEGVRVWRENVYRVFKCLHVSHQASVHTNITPTPDLQISDSLPPIPGTEGERNLLVGELLIVTGLGDHRVTPA